jgi:hypothetical protein
LEQFSGNPYYELLYPYSALAAARLNAQYQYNFKLDNFLQNCFSASSDLVRKDHGVLSSSPKMGKHNGNPLGGVWGNIYPVDGLWGPRGKKSDYYDGWAYPLNSISQATVLAPIVRYDPAYAKAMGRYLLNVTSNFKMFFPVYLAKPFQDETTVAFLDKAPTIYQASIPYEGVRHRYQGREPYAKGDPVEQKWAYTDLSVYSGSMTGYLAAMLKNTSNPYIFMWDLLNTDFHHPKAFPSFLIYNPLKSSQTVSFDLSKLRQKYPELAGNYSLFDTVSKRWVGKGMNSDTPQLLIDSDSAMVLVIVPDSSLQLKSEVMVYSQTDDYRRLTDAGKKTVIDYTFLK